MNRIANKTLSRLKDQMSRGKTANIAKVIQLIQELSSRSLDVSVQELSEIICKDEKIVTKILHSANTIIYNPVGIPIKSVIQAIHLLGVNQISTLTLALLLAENTEDEDNPEEQRDIAALTLCSGFVGQVIMKKRETLDADQAFVCASLRNYGKLLLALFLLDDYRKALEYAETMPVDDAYRKVFGITALELGEHLLRNAELPKAVLDSLREISFEEIKSSEILPETELLIISAFSIQLCELANSRQLSMAQFEKQAEDLVKEYGRHILLDKSEIISVLIDVDSKLSVFCHTHGINSSKNDVIKRIKMRATRRNIPLSEFEGLAKGIADGALNTEIFSKSSFPEGIIDMTNLITCEPIDMDAVLMVALKTIHSGLNLNDCLIFTRDDSEHFSARIGIGPLFETIREQPLVSPDNKDVFAICLNRKQDVLIQNASNDKAKTYIPPWMKSFLNINSFALWPIQHNNKPFAIILATHHDTDAMNFSDSDLKFFNELRNLIVKAYSQIDSDK